MKLKDFQVETEFLSEPATLVMFGQWHIELEDPNPEVVSQAETRLSVEIVPGQFVHGVSAGSGDLYKTHENGTFSLVASSGSNGSWRVYNLELLHQFRQDPANLVEIHQIQQPYRQVLIEAAPFTNERQEGDTEKPLTHLWVTNLPCLS